MLLDQKRGDALVAAGLDELRVSIDAVTPDLYAKLRGIDALPRLSPTYTPLSPVMGHAGKPKLSLWLVGMQENLHELLDFVRLGAAIGVPEVYLQRLVYFGDGNDLTDASTMAPEQSLYGTLEPTSRSVDLPRLKRLATNWAWSFGHRARPPPTRASASRATIRGRAVMRPWSLMYITANGNALPCCIAPFATAGIPATSCSATSSTTLAEVWNGAALSGATHGGAQ